MIFLYPGVTNDEHKSIRCDSRVFPLIQTVKTNYIFNELFHIINILDVKIINPSPDI